MLSNDSNSLSSNVSTIPRQLVPVISAQLISMQAAAEALQGSTLLVLLRIGEKKIKMISRARDVCNGLQIRLVKKRKTPPPT